MSPDVAHPPLTAEELAQRRKTVRKWVLLRGILLGTLLGAWWILFAPDSLMEPRLKNILGVLAGLVATGSYLFNLRATLFPPAIAAPIDDAEKPRTGGTDPGPGAPR